MSKPSSDEIGTKDLIGELLRRYDADWLRFKSHEHGCATFPVVEDEHGQVATGFVELTVSSSMEPSCWLSVERYSPDVDDGEVFVHLRWWQARRLGVQLLKMADVLRSDDCVDRPGGVVDE